MREGPCTGKKEVNSGCRNKVGGEKKGVEKESIVP